MTSPLQRFISSKSMTKEETMANAPAVADRIVESIAGRARALWEYATGENPVIDAGGLPLNPQGLRGCDLSGPPWGPAIKHSLLSTEYYSGTDVYNGKKPLYNIVNLNHKHRKKFCFEVRPFQRSANAPYTRLGLQVCALANSGTPILRFRAYVSGPSGAIDPDRIISEGSFSLTTTFSHSNFFTNVEYIAATMGINWVVIELEWVTASTATQISVFGIQIAQTEELSH